MSSSEGAPALEILAPAKVNLMLAVLGRRHDGFHEIESLVVQIRWFDRLVVRQGEELALRVREDGAAAPNGAANLAWRAAEALAKAAGFKTGTAVIEMDKRIPAGTGLGGGSSDAAATLLGLNRLWGLDWPSDRLMPIAASLGSDVPLFLERGPAVIRGRGECVERLTQCWCGWLALVVPAYPISTAAVYERWRPGERTDGPRGGAAATIARFGAQEASEAFARRLYNDLETAAFDVEPRLAGLHATLNGLETRPVRMTGSGSCLFALFDDESQAQAWRRAALRCLGSGDVIHIVQTL